MPVFHTNCVGISFRGAEVASMIMDIEAAGAWPITLTYQREPENEHDENAIMLFYDDSQVGYIARAVAEWLAPKMDAGQAYDFTATGLVLTKKGGPKWMDVVFKPVEADGKKTGSSSS